LNLLAGCGDADEILPCIAAGLSHAAARILCADLFAQQIDSIGAERVAAIVTDGPTVMEYGKRLLVGAAGKLPAHVDRDKYEGKYKHIIPVRLVCACNMGLALPFSISDY
jgi:hypothetical protein